jgi:hypothetical protein
VRYLGQEAPKISIENGQEETVVTSEGEWSNQPTVGIRIDGGLVSTINQRKAEYVPIAAKAAANAIAPSILP